jgi:hypothetical protein
MCLDVVPLVLEEHAQRYTTPNHTVAHDPCDDDPPGAGRQPGQGCPTREKPCQSPSDTHQTKSGRETQYAKTSKEAERQDSPRLWGSQAEEETAPFRTEKTVIRPHVLSLVGGFCMKPRKGIFQKWGVRTVENHFL